ncbi:MAG: hypothetical protein OEL76_02680 [Siculibacillus sp.]|nr:hypothetical protein [Siculibacillus sp.]
MGDRRVALFLIGLGLAVSGLTLAVGEGLVTGVRAAWPAHVLGAVLVVVGLLGLRGERVERHFPGDGSGGVEIASGHRDDADRRPGRARAANPHHHHDAPSDLGGGEPNGRD